MTYIQKTDSEIKEVANGIYKRSIFPSIFIENAKDISSVFMVLMLMDDKQSEEFKKINVGMVYEYMSEALPRCINGMPIFMSMKILDKKDAKRVMDKYFEIKEVMEKV